MADTDEDDGFSDDDLDALPSHAFLELQQDALRSTQQPKSNPQGSLTRSGVRDLTEGSEDVNIRLQNTTGHHQYPEQPSSDYGDLDEEMLDGEILDAGTQPAVIRQQGNALAPRVAGESTQREQRRRQRHAAPVPAQKLSERQKLNHEYALRIRELDAAQNPGDYDLDDGLQEVYDESEELGTAGENELLQLHVEKVRDGLDVDSGSCRLTLH